MRMGAFSNSSIPDAVAAVLPTSARLECPEQGMTADVMVASNGLQSVVVKRCAHPVYINWLRREPRLLQLLADRGLPVPKFIHYAETSGEAGVEGWLVTSKIEGRSLWKAVLSMAAPHRAPLLRKLGELLRRLHSTPIPAALRDQLPWTERMLQQAESNLSWCDGNAGLLGRLQRTRPPAIAEVLIHGDMALDNVLIADDGKLSLIDWATGDSGDFRCDIALALQSEPETTFADEEVRAFYDGYAGPPVDPATRKWFEELWDFF